MVSLAQEKLDIATCALQGKSPVAARQAAKEAFSLFRLNGGASCGTTKALHLLVRAHLALNEIQAADEVVAPLEATASGSAEPWTRVEPLLAAAEVLAAKGQLEDAITQAAQARDVFLSLGDVLAAAAMLLQSRIYATKEDTMGDAMDTAREAQELAAEKGDLQMEAAAWCAILGLSSDVKQVEKAAGSAVELFISPYLQWREACGQSLEAHVARISFQHAPGELMPPSWKAPEVELSIIVPAYNEEYRIPQMLDETFTYLESRVAGGPSGFTYEVVVVDDGSRDETYAAALGSRQSEVNRPGADLRVIRLVRNRGKGFAVRVGMMAARGRLLLMADADGATRIRDLEALERALAQAGKGGVEIAFGSRHHLKEEALAKRAWYRNILMVAFHFAVWLIIGGKIHDTQCGFKLFHAKVGKQIFSSLHLSRWAFDIEIVILARLFGKPIAEVPVTWVEMPGSKLNLLTGAITMLRDMAMVQVLYALRIWRPATML